MPSSTNNPLVGQVDLPPKYERGKPPPSYGSLFRTSEMNSRPDTVLEERGDPPPSYSSLIRESETSSHCGTVIEIIPETPPPPTTDNHQIPEQRFEKSTKFMMLVILMVSTICLITTFTQERVIESLSSTSTKSFITTTTLPPLRFGFDHHLPFNW